MSCSLLSSSALSSQKPTRRDATRRDARSHHSRRCRRTLSDRCELELLSIECARAALSSTSLHSSALVFLLSGAPRRDRKESAHRPPAGRQSNDRFGRRPGNLPDRRGAERSIERVRRTESRSTEQNTRMGATARRPESHVQYTSVDAPVQLSVPKRPSVRNLADSQIRVLGALTAQRTTNCKAERIPPYYITSIEVCVSVCVFIALMVMCYVVLF